MINTNELITSFYEFIRSNGYKIVERSNLISPYFKGEFNLSGAHSYLIPAVQNNSKVELDTIGVVDLVVRNVDAEIIGISNSHLLLFEMGVFGSFGYVEDLFFEEKKQLKILFEYFETIGIITSEIYITICGGDNYLNEDYGPDEKSKNALIEVGFNTNNIIITKGRRNFMLSKGIDRLAGYNIEFFVKKNGIFIEIASSNIYKYLNKLTHLKETINNGIGCGVGFERLSFVLNDTIDIYDIAPFNIIIDEVKSSFKFSEVDFDIIKSKIFRLAEITKAIIFIVNDGIIVDKTQQGKKLNKYIAKVKSELNYLSLNPNDFTEIVHSVLKSYYKRYSFQDSKLEYVKNKFK